MPCGGSQGIPLYGRDPPIATLPDVSFHSGHHAFYRQQVAARSRCRTRKAGGGSLPLPTPERGATPLRRFLVPGRFSRNGATIKPVGAGPFLLRGVGHGSGVAPLPHPLFFETPRSCHAGSRPSSPTEPSVRHLSDRVFLWNSPTENGRSVGLRAAPGHLPAPNPANDLPAERDYGPIFAAWISRVFRTGMFARFWKNTRPKRGHIWPVKKPEMMLFSANGGCNMIFEKILCRFLGKPGRQIRN